MDNLRFDDKVVIVTGSGRGIGRAEAELFAQRGAAVVVCDTGGAVDGSSGGEDPAQDVVESIKAAGGRAIACRESVATPEGAAAIVATAVATFGRLDIVVNNAGIFGSSPFEDIRLRSLQAQLNVHLIGSFLVTQAAWPHLIAAGEGRIVNTVSAGIWGAPDIVHYGSAKGGVLGLTRNLSVAGAPHGIGVNAIAPGAGTRIADAAVGSVGRAQTEQMRRTMPPELVAPVAVFLAHKLCRLSGEVLTAAGGRVSRMAVAWSKGITDSELTPERIVEALPTILDLDGCHFDDPTAKSPIATTLVP